jgi:endoglucanase
MSEPEQSSSASSEPSMPAVLGKLLAAPGPSGYEQAPAAIWREAAGTFAEVSTDPIGTPLALVAPKSGVE